MSFFNWLRTNAEESLVRAAQTDLYRKYRGPRETEPPEGQDVFWQRVFVPVYRWMPWGLRRRIMQAMPGSHRVWSTRRRR